MLKFLLTFLALYGGLHIYVYAKLQYAFRPSYYLKFILILWLAIMATAPLLVRTAEHYWQNEAALYIAWPAFVWMGFVFIFSSFLFFTDMISYGYKLSIYIRSRGARKTVSSKKITFIALLLAVIAAIYAFNEADNIRTEYLTVASPKISSSVGKIRIVQISDLHIGLLMREKRLRQVVDKIILEKPDILISTGDLVDGKLNRDDGITAFNPLASLLGSAQARLGKFAVIGNHEVYAGVQQAVAFTNAAGFTCLRDQSVPLLNNITITGIEDLAKYSKKYANPIIETGVLNSVSKESFHILLKHRPEIQPDSDGRFDLQLSGHTHNGQIFPFNFLVKFKYSIKSGITETTAGSKIYVSRGTGTWGPPMRLFAPPEITVIDIIPAK